MKQKTARKGGFFMLQYIYENIHIRSNGEKARHVQRRICESRKRNHRQRLYSDQSGMAAKRTGQKPVHAYLHGDGGRSRCDLHDGRLGGKQRRTAGESVCGIPGQAGAV